MFITQPSNVDQYIDMLRFRLGDFTGTTYSTTLLRSALVYAVKWLQPRWNTKYLVWSNETALNPQPADVPVGYIAVSTPHGDAYIVNNNSLSEEFNINDVFRNPFISFEQTNGIFEQVDEEAVILAAMYLTHTAKITQNADSFVSWKTEDIAFSNLGGERVRTNLLTQLLGEINLLFKSKIAKPAISSFPISGNYTMMLKVY